MTRDRLRALLPLVICVALALFAIGWSFTFKEVPPILIRGFQPGAFPRFVGVLILGLSVLAMVHMLRTRESEPHSSLPREYYATILVLIAFGAVAVIGDFLLALMLGTAGIAAFWGERRPLVLLALGIVAPVAVVLLFDELFQVRFPRGFLINLYYG